MTVAVLGYGALAYLFAIATILYGVAFVGHLAVPKTIDSGGASGSADALLVDIALIAAFGLQHSLMARARAKRVWAARLPPAVERSTYVIASGVALAALYAFWRPIPDPVWTVETPAAVALLRGTYWLGWSIVLVSAVSLDHFHLFGLRQAYTYATGRPEPPPRFLEPLPYRYVRHPLMLGLLIAFWATPEMTVGHVVFSSGMTAYVLIGIRLEERDLARVLGESYARYRREVAMLIPFLKWPFRRTT